MKSLLFIGLFCFLISVALTCTVTTASGTRAPSGFCSGDLIFEDNFNSLDQSKWRHEMTLAGGGNWEFQWYVNDRFNSYTTGGNLHIRPTYTSDIFGEDFLRTGHVIIPPEQCTIDWHYGCERRGTPDNIINPIRSASLTTWVTFRFKYGTVEFRAKMPAGDWLWPALWFMPRYSVYGAWPRSGEIDMMESRGNRQLFSDGANVGVEQGGSTIHYGPNPDFNDFMNSHATRNRIPGWDQGFHVYKLLWTPIELIFWYDDAVVLHVPVGEGFWKRGGFNSSGWENPWAGASPMAPFDQEFYIIMNLAVGGVNYFADNFVNQPAPKPW